VQHRSKTKNVGTLPPLSSLNLLTIRDRDFKYAPVQPAPTFVPGVPPDYCDLPSAGCESYLSN
jgi:hypothetical protein